MLGTTFMRALCQILPLCALFCAIWVLEGSGQTSTPAPSDKRPASTRLVILLVDSLAREDVETLGRMPGLRARLTRDPGLHGPMSACADAITVPCFSAMNTGQDAQSVFAVSKNFTPDAGIAQEGVIGAFRRRGLRVGYVGDDIIGTAVQGLDVVEVHKHDSDILTRGLVLLEQGLDVLVIHTHETDEVAHKKTGRSPEYQAVLKQVDANIARVQRALKPTDHFVVLGDHGHSPDGRHFAGLEVPSYAAYFGPKFTRRVVRPMAVTDQGAIWAHVFDMNVGEVPWVDDYFAGREVSIPNALEAPRGKDPIPRSTALLVSLLALSASVLGVRKARFSSQRALLISALLTAVVGVLVGTYWIELTNLIWAQPMYVRWLVAVVCALVGGSCLWPVLAPRAPIDALRLYALLFAGLTVFALPTVYKHGGMFTVQSFLGLGLLLAGLGALVQKRSREALSVLALWFPLWTVYNPNVNNFALRYFPAYREFLFPVIAPLCLSLLLWAVWPVPEDDASTNTALHEHPRFKALVLGTAFAAFSAKLPAHVYIVPCVLAWPLALGSLRAKALVPWAIFMAIPGAWFFAKSDLVTLGPSIAVLVLWAYVPARALKHSRLVALTSVVVLTWLSLWASMGARIAGLDFDFFFRWLPEDQAVTDLWLPQAILTTTKYLLLPTLGLSLALERAPELRTLIADAAHLAAARSSFVIIVLTARAQTSGHAAPFIIADIAQDATAAAIMATLLAGCAAFVAGAEAPVGESLPKTASDPAPAE